MASTRNFPSLLFFDTRLYFFQLKWASPNLLKIQAIKKSETIKCFRTEVKGEDKKSLELIKRLYEYIQVKLAMTLRDQIDHLSSVITVIDRSDQLVSQFRLRIMMVEADKTDIKQFPIKMEVANESYFLLKKLERLEHEKELDRQMLANVWQQKQNNTQKIVEIKQQMQQMNLNKQLQGLINSVKSLQNKLQEKSKNSGHRKKRQQSDSSDSQGEKNKQIDMKELQKKLRKKIKKEIKHKKKQKRRRRKLKRKQKKQKRRIKKALKKTQLQGDQQLAENLKDYVEIDNGNNKEQILISNSNEEQEERKTNQKQILNIQDIEQREREQRKDAKKKKKQKHRHHQKAENINFIVPLNTSVLKMSKLRNRDPNQLINQKTLDSIDIQSPQIVMEQPRVKKQKKSKKNKKQNKKRQPEVMNQQMLEQEGQRQYYRKLQEIRKQGNIQQARLARINRIKAASKPKQVVVLEEDEFNPHYNGEPKYKPFVSFNEFQHKRPRDIFPERLQQISSQCRRIPIIFREQTPFYKNFDVNGNVVRKINGINYHQLVFDYPIPNTGRHVLTMRSVVSKRQYTWFGVIDIRQKDRESSFDRKFCISFSFRTGHVSTNQKWGRQKLGRLAEGSVISMQVNMDKKCIIWHTNNGKNNIANIPKSFLKVTLVPYFQLMDIEDEVYFEQSI